MFEKRKSNIALIVLCCLLISLMVVPSLHAAWWKTFLLKIESAATWLGIVQASLELLEYDLGEVQADLFKKNKSVNALDKDLDSHEESLNQAKAAHTDATNRAMSANSRIQSLESDLENARARKSEAWQAIRWYIDNHSEYWNEPGYTYWQGVRKEWEATISSLNTQIGTAKSDKSSAEIDVRMYASKIDGIQGLINAAETEFEALIAEKKALEEREKELIRQVAAKKEEMKKADEDADQAVEDYEKEKKARPNDPPPQ